MFPRMLMKLVSLRTLSSVHSEQVFALRLQDKKLPPLLSEIWDVHEWASAPPPGQKASVRETWLGRGRLQTEHGVLKGWNVSHSHEEPDIFVILFFFILFLDFNILDPVVSELLPLNALLIDCVARSSSGTVQNR